MSEYVYDGSVFYKQWPKAVLEGRLDHIDKTRDEYTAIVGTIKHYHCTHCKGDVEGCQGSI